MIVHINMQTSSTAVTTSRCVAPRPPDDSASLARPFAVDPPAGMHPFSHSPGGGPLFTASTTSSNPPPTKRQRTTAKSLRRTGWAEETNRPRKMNATARERVNNVAPSEPRQPRKSVALAVSATSCPPGGQPRPSKSPVASTSAAAPFWTPRLQDEYARCILPTVTACAASHTIVSSSCSVVVERTSSWTHRRWIPPQATMEHTANGISPPISSRSSPCLARAFKDRAHAAQREQHAVRNAFAKRRKVTPSPQLPDKPPEDAGTVLRAYRLRLRRLTPEQTKVLRTWFAAQRWGFNTMLAAVRSGSTANTQQGANEVANTRPAWVKDTHRQIYKNAMMDVVIAGTGEKTKTENNPKHRGTIQFRSLWRTLTEVCRLDKCQWKTDDPNHERTPHDKGLVLGIRAVPEETVSTESPRRRLRARIEFGRGLGFVEVHTFQPDRRKRRWHS